MSGIVRKGRRENGEGGMRREGTGGLLEREAVRRDGLGVVVHMLGVDVRDGAHGKRRLIPREAQHDVVVWSEKGRKIEAVANYS